MGKKRKKRVVLGLDIGGTGIKGALVDTKKGQLVTDRHRIPTPQPATPEAVTDTVVAIVKHFGWDRRVGCTMPARVRRGTAETASNIDPAWIGTDAAKLFRDATGCKTLVLNDADAAGIAEMEFGAGRGCDGTVVMLTLGTGIGSAVFINGELLPNTEFGHLELDGLILEHRASNAVRKNEELPWETWAERVQEVLDHIEFIVSPDLLIIGGGVSRPHRWELFAHLLQTRARLEPAQLENEAGIVGAAYQARKK
ncbi:MAG: ROK family protein [Rhodothermales bacterium]|nr:ROK family protein [Rhodothermales bacterium]